jgi:hypothetical protein
VGFAAGPMTASIGIDHTAIRIKCGNSGDIRDRIIINATETRICDRLTVHDYTFPPADGSAGEALLTDGAGQLQWCGVALNGGQDAGQDGSLTLGTVDNSPLKLISGGKTYITVAPDGVATERLTVCGYTLPEADGAAGTVLQTDGAGGMRWASIIQNGGQPGDIIIGSTTPSPVLLGYDGNTRVRIGDATEVIGELAVDRLRAPHSAVRTIVADSDVNPNDVYIIADASSGNITIRLERIQNGTGPGRVITVARADRPDRGAGANAVAIMPAREESIMGIPNAPLLLEPGAPAVVLISGPDSWLKK